MSIPTKLNPLGINNKKNSFETPLTFTALENNSSVQLIGENPENGTIDFSKMYYRTSINSQWIIYENQRIDLYNKGNYVQFWNKNNILTPGVFNYYAHFIMTGKISGSGNIQSLLNFDKYTNNYCFYSLFRDCTSLIYPPELLGKNYTNCYNSMFWGCSNLIKAPDLMDDYVAGQSYCQMFVSCSSLVLPAKMPKIITNIYYGSFLSMYSGCSKLIETPDIIINSNIISDYTFYCMLYNCINLKTSKIKMLCQKIGSHSCRNMFYNCKELTNAPELPATILSPYCYERMFYNCYSLQKAPDLPAVILAQGCYSNMFDYCYSLTKLPQLNATIMEAECYRSMFWHCNNIIDNVYLPAQVLDNMCFYYMFEGCSKINKIKVNFTEWNDEQQYTTGWVNNVSSSGTFIKTNSLSEEYGNNRIPTNWQVINAETIPLTFTAEEANSKVTLTTQGSLTLSNLEYKTNNDVDWQPYSINSEKTLTNVGDYIQFRNNSTNLSTAKNNYAQFVMQGKLKGSGNIQSLLNFRNDKKAPNYCFRRLFYNCTSLITPPDLYATTAGQHSYSSMFNASGITIPPVIKAESVGKYCCYYMFESCNSLLQAPQLPATTLQTYCYQNMFYHCRNLICTMSELPAQSLKTSCYLSMFQGCSKLSKVMSILPAQTLKDNCYSAMFQSCDILEKAPELPAPTLYHSCYNNMFNYCYKLNYIKVGFTAWVNGCTSYWVTNGTVNGIFECPQALDTININRDGNTVLPNWTIVKY